MRDSVDNTFKPRKVALRVMPKDQRNFSAPEKMYLIPAMLALENLNNITEAALALATASLSDECVRELASLPKS